MVPTLIVAVLILLNGLFVAAEFAIVGSPRLAIERLARKGNRLAGLVHRVLRDAREQDRYIATAQLGITSASLGLGMYGEHVLAEWLVDRLEPLGDLRGVGAHAIASIVAITGLTYLHVVFGEMVPKSLALQSPASMALAVAVPMRIIELLVYPLVVALNGLGNAVLRVFGVQRTAGGEERYRSADEIAFIVAESRAGGMLAREPARVIQELLEFGDITAGEVMVPRTRIVTLSLGADWSTIASTIAGERHTRYPVVEGDADHVIGVVHVKDLLRDFSPDRRLDRELLRDVPFLPATLPLERVLAELRRVHAHLAIVMDEHGGTAGMLTLEDLFEEVVGQIGDPGETPMIRRDAEGRLLLAGVTRIDELAEAVGMSLEHDEVDTVSGLVIATLGRPPRVGDHVEHEGLELEVTAVRGRGVQEVRVSSPPARRPTGPRT